MRLVLPDCGRDLDVFYLTLEQRRELLLLLAERGEAGIDEFIRRHEKDDSQIGRKVNRLRQRLLAEAEELKRRLHSDYDLRRDEERKRYEKVLQRLREDEERLASERRRLDLELPDELRRRVHELPLLQLAVQPPRLPWWRRLYNFLWRILSALWRLLTWPFRRHQRLGRPKMIAIGVPGLAGPGIEIEVDLETALRSNPDLRRRIRRGMGGTFAARARRMMRVLLGLENYADVAQEVLEQAARESVSKEAAEAEARRRRLEDDLARDRREEEESQRLLNEQLAKLNEAERVEEERLRATLAQRPSEEVRRLVTEELEAAGLVERLGDGLRLTGRFLDTFAALVYTEESRGISPTRESALGSSIEGEGILERSRLLSHAEASHMDTVGTLVNARTYHPHVRHLLEEDVVIYREQRASQTHIVIVVDQSLSMEENERMTAAKRAALALYYQTRRKGARHKIDFILMETGVKRASLAEVWDAKPKGFTNVGRALEVAHAILSSSRANRRILFLVTDGLPEAVTVDGKDVAAKPEEALTYALRQAARLKRLPGLAFSLVLLEARDPLFLAAAQKIAAKAGGRIAKVEPQELVKSLLVQVRQDELLAA